MTPSRRWWRRQRHDPDREAGTAPAAPATEPPTMEQVEELKNEVAELRQDTEDLKQRLKEAEVLLRTVAEDSEEQERATDMLVEWCQEQEVVLGKHRDVVTAIGAAASVLRAEGGDKEVDAALDLSETEEPHDPSS